MNRINIIREIETPTLVIKLRSDDIIHCTFKDHVTLDVEQQLFNYKAYSEIAGERKFPFLFDAREGVWITKEARDNGPKIEHLSPSIATAIVVNTLPYKLIANFYLTFNKPKKPYKVFNSEEKAIRWLKTFRVKV